MLKDSYITGTFRAASSPMKKFGAGDRDESRKVVVLSVYLVLQG